MKIFKNLFIIGAIGVCFASCSKHTTCSAYTVNYETNDNQEDWYGQVSEKQVESLWNFCNF